MSRERIWIIEDDDSHCGEVLGSEMMLGNKCNDVGEQVQGSGTGTKKIGTPKAEIQQ